MLISQYMMVGNYYVMHPKLKISGMSNKSQSLILILALKPLMGLWCYLFAFSCNNLNNSNVGACANWDTTQAQELRFSMHNLISHNFVTVQLNLEGKWRTCSCESGKRIWTSTTTVKSPLFSIAAHSLSTRSGVMGDKYIHKLRYYYGHVKIYSDAYFRLEDKCEILSTLHSHRFWAKIFALVLCRWKHRGSKFSPYLKKKKWTFFVKSFSSIEKDRISSCCRNWW